MAVADFWDFVHKMNEDMKKRAVDSALERIEERIRGAIAEMRMQGAHDPFDKGYIQGLYRALDIINEERDGRDD